MSVYVGKDRVIAVLLVTEPNQKQPQCFTTEEEIKKFWPSPKTYDEE
jgi:hypothetical protein